jgi:dihydropteroate synthase
VPIVGPRGLPAHVSGLDRALVIGVLNVTPDSFSDGGLYADSQAAIDYGIWMVRHGADIVDVGGESTRPGARRVDVAEELRRVLPVVRALTAAGVLTSIDTMRGAVACEAVAAGAVMVNDVSGGLADEAMLLAVAGLDVPYVAMHWRAHGRVMHQFAEYADVVIDVRSELAARLEAADAVGLDLDRVVVDPGIGFAKNASDNWALLHRLDALAQLGRPILVGTSRKRFLGSLLANDDGSPRAPRERDHATTATTALAAVAGAWAVRVHDVEGSADAVRVAAAWQAGVGP